ncbi:MFS transporter [Rhodanobacter sp. PCA2]|uniref:nitrate/nitrite transporter n=1 Tax=Rhodanobacter sp. PCA2 TaxID=2006117 RepID=UPI0015E6FA68|nr:MFS transporter [Rhodanobacter sp. PCA2]MBA2078323.1 MFS transporter [Rhodanobacter sp. PCA2]
MTTAAGSGVVHRGRALWLSTISFTVCFAVWMIFAIIGIKIQKELGLSNFELGLLQATPVLSGSLIRLVLGVWTDQYGGRRIFTLVMLSAAVAAFCLTLAHTYTQFLVAALFLGIAGGSFAVGTAYVTRFYESGKQGLALGIFGAGNVGAAVTKLSAPPLIEFYGFSWQHVAYIWAAAIFVMGIIFWIFSEEDPVVRERREKGIKPKSAWLEFQPLKNIQVWRFSLYYFYVFGAFVALSLWLPKYLMAVYNIDLFTGGQIAAAFSIPASVFRAYGGHLADRYGARRVMYWSLMVGAAATFVLSYPAMDIVVRTVKGPVTFHYGMSLLFFAVMGSVLGFFMALGKAAVYKHIPVYYPHNMGAVGGLVGMIGGLGGAVLPPVFGLLVDLTGVWQTCFMLLFALVMVSLTWMHVSIRRMERGATGEALRKLPEFPEMQPVHTPDMVGAMAGKVLAEWQPEDKKFWEGGGRKIARRNLWISIPNLLLAFAIWQVWSVVVAQLPRVGFAYTTDQLFWLAALPGLSGGTLRIFYSFMVPILGGRMWTTLATWSLLIPALGIGYAVQNPQTPYWMMLGLALLCGFGGGNFASSMANISFFFPRAEKGNALALNAGLGNLGVSVVQFVVPMVITAGVLGWFGGSPTLVGPEKTPLWLQNAAFIWVPFIALSAFAAWFGMNDIASAKASFADQAVIFQRKHNWLMCWLYLGTFGSFIGYAAGFPLLTKTQFPDVNAMQYVFLGPLIGAISRSAAGWLSDKWGGARITLWVFVLMIVGVLGVLYFLSVKEQPNAFWGFFASFMLLFFATGVGNASTFQMIPNIMRQEMIRLMPTADIDTRLRQAEKESAAITGFTSAIAAYGFFLIPVLYATVGAIWALWLFLAFYVSCVVLTWAVYTRKGGLLHDVERHGRFFSPSQFMG